MRARRIEQGDAGDPGAMRWLLTYADMVSLLLAFFVMLYSMSQISAEKFARAAAVLRAEFGQPRARPEGMGERMLPHVRDSQTAPTLEDDVQSIEEQILAYAAEAGLADLVRTEHQTRGLVISVLSDNLLFPVGEAELRPGGLALLDRIAGLLRDIPYEIGIEGHTCDLPISTARFPSNWELSAARACTVVRYLSDQWGFPPTRLVASGYADSRPAAPNTSTETRVHNRRVDIVILAQDEKPPAGEPEVAP